MSGPGAGPPDTGTGPQDKDPKSRNPRDRNYSPGPPSASAGWAVTSYLIGGMAFYGGAGWLIGRWTGIAALFPAGMLLGLALAIALIIFRYARP